MHQRFLRRVAPLALATLLSVSMISCATTPTRPVIVLPNGYVLEAARTGQSEIARRGGRIVVPAPIAAYGVYRNVVAGALGEVPPSSHLFPDKAYEPGPQTLYFVLDTVSGKLESGLTSQAWHARLKALGVPSVFEISIPPPWQQQ